MVCSNEDCCAEGPISTDDPEGSWNRRTEPVAVTAEELAREIEDNVYAVDDLPDNAPSVRGVVDAATAILTLLREKGLTR